MGRTAGIVMHVKPRESANLWPELHNGGGPRRSLRSEARPVRGREDERGGHGDADGGLGPPSKLRKNTFSGLLRVKIPEENKNFLSCVQAQPTDLTSVSQRGSAFTAGK